MRWHNDRRLAKEVPEIHLILGGHDHDYQQEMVSTATGLPLTPSYSTHSPTHSPIHPPFTHATHPSTIHTRSHPLSHSHPSTQSPIHTPTHSLTLPLTLSLTLSHAHSLTNSLTHPPHAHEREMCSVSIADLCSVSIADSCSNSHLYMHDLALLSHLSSCVWYISWSSALFLSLFRLTIH